ncbi:MAG: hypothetical protein CMH49_06940 [Myxococcales bacterium]|nr:hypothetical protein [Myxococcales bacterium]
MILQKFSNKPILSSNQIGLNTISLTLRKVSYLFQSGSLFLNKLLDTRLKLKSNDKMYHKANTSSSSNVRCVNEQ